VAEFNLAALMKDVSVPDTGKDQIRYIAYRYLIPAENNGYSMDGLEELARSIEIIGLQQPLRVQRRADDTYTILSGHRRHAAIGLLIDQGSKQFDEGVPCVVDSASASAAMQELRLLLGNADNRKMTSADEAQQAERISDCIRRLEDEGFEFPGRHRDWVSKLSGLSRTKLARLSAIRNNLIPELYGWYQKNHFGETAAYELQKLPKEGQQVIAESCKRSGDAYFIKTDGAAHAAEYAEQYMKHLECEDGSECVHRAQRFLQPLREPMTWAQCKGGCCLKCSNLERCAYPCSKGRARKKAAKEQETEAREKEAAKRERDQEKQQKEYRSMMQAEAQRLIPLIDKAELDDKTDLPGRFSYTKNKVSEIRKYAKGDFKPDDHYYSGSFLPSYIEDLTKLADQLDCSLDYLTGRSEAPKAESVSGTDTDPEWKTGDPPRNGRYFCLVDLNLNQPAEQRCEWEDGKWMAYGRPVDDLFKVLAWWPLPANNRLKRIPEESDE
jgi:ParB family chromosome partitioning protein